MSRPRPQVRAELVARAAAAIELLRVATHAVDVDLRRDGAEWAAVGVWPGKPGPNEGMRVVRVEGARTAADAVEALAAQMMENATCNGCRRPVTLDGLTSNLHATVTGMLIAGARAEAGSMCAWRREGTRWVSGCAEEPPRP